MVATTKAAKAQKANTVRVAKAYKEFLAEVRDAQTKVFLGASSTEAEILEARAIVRALQKVENLMAATSFDYQLEQKREAKRTS